MEIQRMVKEILAQEGITEAYLAALVGYSQSGISRLKQGPTPSFYFVVKRIEALHRELFAELDDASMQ